MPVGPWLLAAALLGALSACSDDSAPTPTTGLRGNDDAGMDAGPAAGPGRNNPETGPPPGAIRADSGPDDEDAGRERCNPTECAKQNTECVDAACDAAGETCVLSNKNEGGLCGDGADTVCSNPDRCMLGACIPNHAPSGMVCADEGKECKVADTCDGNGTCVNNGSTAAGTACGDSTATECNAADSCDGNGSCKANYAEVDAPCGDQGLDCFNNDKCDGTGTCVDNGLWVADTNSCGGKGRIDLGGSTWACRCGDTSIPVHPVCNPTATVCTAGGACVPTFAADNTFCQAKDGANDCDLDDTCQGGRCVNAIEVDDTPCGSTADNGICDRPDSCQAGVCDDGSADTGTLCNMSSNECVLNDLCDGVGNCLAGADKSQGVTCGDPTVTSCDAADSCDGAGSCDDNLQPSGAACGSQVNTECDNADTCDGSGFCQTNAENFGVPCGDTTDKGDCDQPDICSGAGSCLVREASDNSPCGTPGPCDVQDTCEEGLCADNGVVSNCSGTITGKVIDLGVGVVGITVHVVGASPANSTVSEADGYFSLDDIPFNQEVVLRGAEVPGTFWGEIEVHPIGPTGEFVSVTMRREADMAALPGPPDVTKGMVLVIFSGTLTGAETLTMSPGAITPNISAAPNYAFTGLTPGDYTVVPVGDTSTCRLASESFTALPVMAHHVTVVEVFCE